MSDLFSLDGRVALVTGASRGLGWAMAEALARHGATVLLNARGRDALATKAAELTGAGLQAAAVPFDVNDGAAVAAAIADIVKRHGRLDILINNAGIQHRVPLTEWQDADWLRIFLVETIGYVIAWVAFPLIMVPVTRFLVREHLWLDFIVVYNWSQVLQIGFIVIANGLSESGILPSPLAAGIASAATLAVLGYQWFVARVALDISGAAAVMIVLVDLVLGVFITRVAQALH